jgi:2',3'-cyclic-nucleotide 2'-phosphodiesterase
VERALDACRLGRDCDAVILDFHAETTSEKMAMGHFCDGRASLVVGTHTHTPTADLHVLKGGTAYQTDAGMCGDYDSVIGMDKAEPLQRFLRKLPVERMKPAEGEATVCGVIVETDDITGLAKRAAPIRVGGLLSQTGMGDWT